VTEPPVVVGLRFKSGQVPVAKVESELSRIVQELGDPASEIAQAARTESFSESDLVGVHVSVTAENDKKGFGFIPILIEIGIDLAKDAVEKLWEKVIWPKLKDRLGGDALGERLSDESA
jgi:hypothetical protein